jgi:hypothetical protein
VLQQLRDEYCAAANGERNVTLQAFEAMKPYLGGNEMTAAECRALADRLGIEANAAKQRVHRLRRRAPARAHRLRPWTAETVARGAHDLCGARLHVRERW